MHDVLQLLLKVSTPWGDFQLDSMLKFSHCNDYYSISIAYINGIIEEL